MTRIAGWVLAATILSAPIARAQDVVRGVDWFMAHTAETNRVLRLCRNDPGSARRVPNCLNAQTAFERTFSQRFIGQAQRRRDYDFAALCAGVPAWARTGSQCR